MTLKKDRNQDVNLIPIPTIKLRLFFASTMDYKIVLNKLRWVQQVVNFAKDYNLANPEADKVLNR